MGSTPRWRGELTVRESPGVPTTGSGQLSVAGRYKAYGQDLTIKDGRLLFAGTPLDNPRLAIVAMREVDDDLSTGLRIAGTAQRPIVTVVSSPNVGEADALSYLVTGTLAVGCGQRERQFAGRARLGVTIAGRRGRGPRGAAHRQAARPRRGRGRGKRIDRRLGADRSVEYLSPRLYLSYGVGLFEPGEVIGLRYKLTK